MKAYVKIYVGPMHINQWAEKFTRAGYTPDVIGTEHLYLWLPMDPNGWGILPALDKMETTICGRKSGALLDGVIMRTAEV